MTSSSNLPAFNNLSTSSILLDTHIALWLAAENNRLNRATLAIVAKHFEQRTMCMSPISAWEIGMLASQKKIYLADPPQIWFAEFTERFSINLLEITPEIAINSSYLPGKFHNDPADRILVATARKHSMALMTADKEILSYSKQDHVQTIKV